jgi:hypothetical protein
MVKVFWGFAAAFFFAVALLGADEVLRGEVMVELEPVYGPYVDVKYPLDREDAYRRGLEEGALFFSASIYGWTFDYEIGERARNIAEAFELSPLGEIRWGDPGLRVTHASFKNLRLWMWLDYRMRADQIRRAAVWTTGLTRSAQAVGYGPLGRPEHTSEWLEVRKTALEDAARAAVRAMLQGSERNRPKEARGVIGLDSFPRFWMDGGRWACSARFRVQIQEIVPFAAY